MFNKKLRLFKVHYVEHCLGFKRSGETIVIAKDESHVVKEFYKRAIHVGDDITKIEEYEVEKIEG